MVRSKCASVPAKPEPQHNHLLAALSPEVQGECYGVVKKETELLLNYMPQRQVIKNADAIPTATLETA